MSKLENRNQVKIQNFEKKNLMKSAWKLELSKNKQNILR